MEIIEFIQTELLLWLGTPCISTTGTTFTTTGTCLPQSGCLPQPGQKVRNVTNALTLVLGKGRMSKVQFLTKRVFFSPTGCFTNRDVLPPTGCLPTGMFYQPGLLPQLGLVYHSRDQYFPNGTILPQPGPVFPQWDYLHSRDQYFPNGLF